MPELTEIALDELKLKPLPEHAAEIAKLCDLVVPYFVQLEARIKYEMPEATEIARWSDYAQFSPRKLNEAIADAFKKVVPM